MKFKLYWRGGDSEFIEGNNIVDALNKAGYGSGATTQLECWHRANEENQTKGAEGNE